MFYFWFNFEIIKKKEFKMYSKDFFNNTVLVVRNKEQLEKILSDLNVKNLEISNKTYPIIIYQGLNQSIDMSEIEESSLLKLKYDNEFNRKIIEI